MPRDRLKQYLWKGILGLVRICFAIIILGLVVGQEGDGPTCDLSPPSCHEIADDKGEVIPNPPWDTDGDGISDAVETHLPNVFRYGFDPDVPNANPSIARGSPTDGMLENGINLPDAGEGYFHYPGEDPPDRDDWGTLALINMIEGAGRRWLFGLGYFPAFGVGDMSLPEGGTFTDFFNPNEIEHVSHQNGLDLDVRYRRDDGTADRINIALDPDDHYDPAATLDLMNSFILNGNVTVIFVDIEHVGIVSTLFMHMLGHSNHFHVRIQDPDGTNN